jgi:hypothetical protein
MDHLMKFYLMIAIQVLNPVIIQSQMDILQWQENKS